MTWLAGHGPRLAVPPRVRAGHEFDSAVGADVGVTKRQALGRHRETVSIVGTVSMALTLRHWCLEVTIRRVGGHIWNSLRDRKTKDFKVRDVIAQTVVSTNSAPILSWPKWLHPRRNSCDELCRLDFGLNQDLNA